MKPEYTCRDTPPGVSADLQPVRKFAILLDTAWVLSYTRSLRFQISEFPEKEPDFAPE